MQIFLAGYIVIEICEIFTVGGFPLDSDVRKVRGFVMDSCRFLSLTNMGVIPGIFGRPYSRHHGYMLDSSLKLISELPDPRRRHLDLHLPLPRLRRRPVHRDRLHRIGHGVQLDGWIRSKLHAAQSKYSPVRAVPAIPAGLSLLLLCSGNCHRPWDFARRKANAYVTHTKPSRLSRTDMLHTVYLVLSTVLFAIGQIFQYIISSHLCHATHGKINGTLFETFFTLLSVIIIWLFWSSITEDEWPAPSSPTSEYENNWFSWMDIISFLSYYIFNLSFSKPFDRYRRTWTSSSPPQRMRAGDQV